MKKIIVATAFIISLAMSESADGICSKPVDTAEGPVAGMAEKKADACVWKGIPYAAPPLGELRWKPPHPAAKRSAIYEAYEYGAECSQVEPTPGYLMFGKKPVRNEDCLYLNIWRPRKGGTFPVMVWIHGGGLTSGAGSSPMYWGDRLVSSKDVVLVSFNYRLGAFGFLAHSQLSEEDERASSGNYGLLDQIAALEWVRENIAGFNGDPDNVTIFGESAGGRSVCFHMASPLSSGLFHKAIMQSGSCDTVNTMEDGFENGKEFAFAAGCPDENQLDCLRSKSSEEIVEAMDEFDLSTDDLLLLKRPKRTWMAHMDNWAFSEAPIDSLRSGNYNRVPFMAGTTRDEFKLFAAMFGFRKTKKPGIIEAVVDSLGESLLPVFEKFYPFDSYKKPADAYIHAKGDVFLGCNTFEAVEASSEYQPTYYYRFDYDVHRLPNVLGASHGTEIPFIFDNLDRSLFAMLYSGRQRKKARLLVEAMMSYWADFAHNHEPGDGGSMNWPRYDKDKRLRIYLDLPIKVRPTDNLEKCEFWKEQGLVK